MALFDLGNPAEIRTLLASGKELPSPQQSGEIFVSLHRNIYRAFDYSNESDIYDALSKSVAGPMLDKIYGEVYQSLLLRDEGGVVSQVRAVNILSSTLLSAEQEGDDPQFRIRATWEVDSAVRHLTHTHTRKSQYEGIYSVGQVNGGWRIIDDQILRERRVAEDWRPYATESSPLPKNAS